MLLVMPTVADVLATIDRIAPWRDALPMDKVGLQVGRSEATVTHAYVALDRSVEVIRLAAETGAQLVVSHHPLIWDPLKHVLTSEMQGEALEILLKHDMSLIAAHTNWDVAVGGISESMASLIGLSNCANFGQVAPGSLLPLGRVGTLAQPLALRDFVKHVDKAFGTVSMAWGDSEKMISKVGVVGGAGATEWRAALALGADAFVTGEVPQHEALAASHFGVAMLASGHYATEHPGCEALRDALARELPEIAWTLFEPHPGKSGRPLE